MYMITQPALISENGEIRPQKRANIRAHRIEGEAVLYNEADRTTFHLNETAVFIWDSCDGHRTLGDLGRMLSECYEVEAVTAQDDVDQIVAFLADSQLVGAEVLCGTHDR